MKTLIKILQNTTNQTWHPIMYRESPLPGNPDNLIRYKSIGHHTTGFKTRAAALEEVNSESFVERLKTISTGPLYKVEQDILWDGTGIPANTEILLPEEVN